MIIIELTYKRSHDEVNKLLPGHRDFLDKYYRERLFLASGPKSPRDGGIILAMGDRATINKALEEDPFYQHEIADYRVIEFEPNKYSDEFKNILGIKNTN